MQKEINTGVMLNVIPTQQFKTTRVVISFLKELTDRKELVMRTLLANILETSSQAYPTQKAVALELSKMYGASFGTTVSRRGQVHILNFVLNCVNDNYLLHPEDLLGQVFSFLKELIFAPLANDGAFDEVTFMRQKLNLTAYIEAVKDNKQSYAALELQKIYFEDAIQQAANYGTVEDLAPITATELYAYYLEMLQNDQIQIFVSGDVLEAEVEANALALPFDKRTTALTKFCYQQPMRAQVVEVVEEQTLNQSKLDLAYRLPTTYRDEKHYAAVVFNALLGGSPQSKLFTNVREKESLAYYASSNFDPFRQLLLIQTGIKTSDKEKAYNLIKQQVADLAAGKFSGAELENIKLNLINGYESRLDNQMTAITRSQLDILSQVSETPATWIEKIDQVSAQDVVEVANLAELQAVFFLDGGHV